MVADVVSIFFSIIAPHPSDSLDSYFFAQAGRYLGGCFKYCLMFTLNWGNYPN